MPGRFEGQIALVTGAGSGIGKGCALRLTREGALTALVDVNKAAIQQTATDMGQIGSKAMTLVGDVSNPEDTQATIDRIVAEFGRIDICINAAGIVKSQGFFEVSEEDWDRIVDVNQKGTAFMCQKVGAQMVQQVPEDVKTRGRSAACYGKIVNFSSIAGRRGRAFQLHYAASKAAIISITQSAALALAPYGINVNAISPSAVVTPMLIASNTQKAKTLGVTLDQVNEGFIAKIPLLRMGEIEEIAAAAAFLCSRDADFITGQTLNVDGGYEMD